LCSSWGIVRPLRTKRTSTSGQIVGTLLIRPEEERVIRHKLYWNTHLTILFVGSLITTIDSATSIVLQGCSSTTCTALHALPQAQSGVCQQAGATHSFVLFLGNEQYPDWNTSLIPDRASRPANEADLCWSSGLVCDFSQSTTCQTITSGSCFRPTVVAAAYYKSATAQWDTPADSSNVDFRALIIGFAVGLPLALAICIVIAVATVKPVRKYFFPTIPVEKDGKQLESAEEGVVRL